MEVNGIAVAAVGLLVAVVIAAIVGISRLLVHFKGDIPRLTQSLLERMPTLIQEAAKYAALFVERLDQNGELGSMIDEFADKADEKLDLAVDIAVERLEIWIAEITEKLGVGRIEVDIPEDTIKDYIQRYVWENPDLFPAKKEAKLKELAIKYDTTLHEMKASTKQRSENYPASFYKETPPTEGE